MIILTDSAMQTRPASGYELVMGSVTDHRTGFYRVQTGKRRRSDYGQTLIGLCRPGSTLERLLGVGRGPFCLIEAVGLLALARRSPISRHARSNAAGISAGHSGGPISWGKSASTPVDD